MRFPTEGDYEFKVSTDNYTDTLEMYVEYIPKI